MEELEELLFIESTLSWLKFDSRVWLSFIRPLMLFSSCIFDACNLIFSSTILRCYSLSSAFSFWIFLISSSNLWISSFALPTSSSIDFFFSSFLRSLSYYCWIYSLSTRNLMHSFFKSWVCSLSWPSTSNSFCNALIVYSFPINFDCNYSFKDVKSIIFYSNVSTLVFRSV